MEWLMQLQGQVVGLDTAPLIYLIEQNQVYLGLVRAFFGALSRGEFQVVTSTLTLTEVLVHPLRSGNVELAGQYRDILLDQENLIRVCCIVPQRESRSHTVGKMVVSSLSFSILSGVRS
jgi:hypothetical protein